MNTPGQTPLFTLAAPRHPAGRTLVLGVLALLAGLGCRSEMYDQPKYKPFEATNFFDDNNSSRLLPAGVVPRNTAAVGAKKVGFNLAEQDFLHRGITGVNAEGIPQESTEYPFRLSLDDIKRGQQRYRVNCLPCHGEDGSGRGMIVQRGFPPPPPLYGPITRKPLVGENGQPLATGAVSIYNDLRDAPVGHFVRVIAEGHGAMYSYAARVAPEDRWRIAGYIRALQLSQYATGEDLAGIAAPNDEEQTLKREMAQ